VLRPMKRRLDRCVGQRRGSEENCLVSHASIGLQFIFIQHGPQRCPSSRQPNNTLQLCLAHSRRLGCIHGLESFLPRAHDESRKGLAQPDVSGDGGLCVFGRRKKRGAESGSFREDSQLLD